MEIEVVILAAGSSSRLGQPKQLLKLHNQTLIQLAVTTALKLSPKVHLVLGYQKERMVQEVEEFPIHIIDNPNYSNGMGTSLALAIDAINPTNALLVMLCDQPLIPLTHFQELITRSNPHQIVASLYRNRLAVPALFPPKYFEALKKLEGNKGARELLRSESVLSVELSSDLAMDIDRVEDWEEVKRVYRFREEK
ncbi:MAG: nucleotidyltransferase family protein [Campylobacterales bacterium]|nr:nucleotidyltransferase family protein [Campylobacterales bacterium]